MSFVYLSTCPLCGTPIAHSSATIARARMQEHASEKHPGVDFNVSMPPLPGFDWCHFDNCAGGSRPDGEAVGGEREQLSPEPSARGVAEVAAARRADGKEAGRGE